MSLSAFSSSTLAMMSQTHALDGIGANVANVSTTGYKRTDTRFQTVLGRTWSSASGGDTPPAGTMHSDIAGVLPKDYARISDQGLISTTGRNLDMALVGRGFFVLNSEINGSGQELYTRDGGFGMGLGAPITVTDPDGTTYTENEAYLTAANGDYVQGWAANDDGSFPTGAGALTSIRIDSQAFPLAGQATSRASLALNLPANDMPGDMESFPMEVFDSNGASKSLWLGFTKSATPNTWDLAVSGGPGDVINLSPAQPLSFTAAGGLTAPSQFDIGVTYGDGAISNFGLDVSGFTQFAGPLTEFGYSRDGFGPGVLQSVDLDAEGQVVGMFSNGVSRPLYKLALANFTNPDGLTMLSGNLFTESADSGAAAMGAAGENGLGTLNPEALELSNVDIGDEFTKMIVTQRAYSSAATVFKTVDEMLQVASGLKA